MIRSGVDWIETYNYTQALAVQQGPVGIKFYWQHLMPNGSAFETTKGVAGAATELVVATGGFVPYDSIINNLGPLYTDVTAISNAAIPVVTAASATAANGLSAGSVVRLTNNVGGRQVSGMDFTIGYSTPPAGTFSLEYMPQMVAATTGNWQQVKFDQPFYPKRRFITAVSNAATAVVRMSVSHLFTVGQQVRISVPAGSQAAPIFGMVIPPTQATILAINTATNSTGNTITLDLDTTGLAPFVFPTTAVGALGFTPAEIVPIGEVHKEYIDNLKIAVDRGLKAMQHDFYVVVIVKKEKLLENVLRNYFAERSTCPTPDYDQSVFKYHFYSGNLEYLWTLPDKQTCEIFARNVEKVVKEEQLLLEFVLNFYNGELMRLARKMNGENLETGIVLEGK